jgi:hypothetical protein
MKDLMSPLGSGIPSAMEARASIKGARGGVLKVSEILMFRRRDGIKIWERWARGNLGKVMGRGRGGVRHGTRGGGIIIGEGVTGLRLRIGLRATGKPALKRIDTAAPHRRLRIGLRGRIDRRGSIIWAKGLMEIKIMERVMRMRRRARGVWERDTGIGG